jgi:7-cyano-7-deazaguanine synthase
MMVPQKVIHLLSGGLDSTVLLYDLINQRCDVHCVLFNYGQRHARELSAAESICSNLNHGFTVRVGWTNIRLPKIPGSSLTDGSGSKVVPNRNAIFLSVAVSIAVNAGAESVTIACNKDDANDFLDCRREFIHAMNAASMAGAGVEICAPYINLTKRQIVSLGRSLDVPIEGTWSCYEGGFAPCGACDACLKRAEAMAA